MGRTGERGRADKQMECLICMEASAGEGGK